MAKRRDTGLFAGPMMPESRGYGQQANVLGGTMGAVVYGQNPAAQNLAGNLNAVRQAEQMRINQQQADAQQMAQTWRDNELEAAEGMLWSDQLGGIEQQHVAAGQELMQEGINPYESMNPRAVNYRRQRRDILNQRAYRKGVESQYMKTLEEIRKDPNKYRPDDIQRLNEWVANTKLSDAYSQNQQLPMLRQRFDPSEALKGVRAATTSTTDVKDGWKTERTVIDRPQTEGLILGQLMNSPGGSEFLAGITGGLPVNEVLSVPDSREEIVAALKEGYSGNPRIREQLAAQGIVGDNLVNEWAKEEAARFTGAKRNLKSFLDRQVDASASGVKLEDSRTPDLTQARFRLQQINTALAQQREARLARGEVPETAGIPDPIDIPIPYGPVDEAGNRPRVPARNYLPLSISNKNFMGADAIDLTTGRKTKFDESSTRYSVVGLTEVPIGKGKNVGETLVQENYARENPDRVTYKPMIHVTLGDGEDYFLDLDRMPQGLTKEQKAIISRFKETTGRATTQTSGKTATTSQIRGLVGQPGYEGYTEQELIDYYKSQGYTIK